jgi:hypothetical protein
MPALLAVHYLRPLSISLKRRMITQRDDAGSMERYNKYHLPAVVRPTISTIKLVRTQKKKKSSSKRETNDLEHHENAEQQE